MLYGYVPSIFNVRWARRTLYLSQLSKIEAEAEGLEPPIPVLVEYTAFKAG